MHIWEIVDKEFYEKVVPIVENALLIAEKKPSLDSDIYEIHSEAVKCFFQRQYLETVFFASIGVERRLNKIPDKKGLTNIEKKEWDSLNWNLISKAYKAKIIAVTELLDDSEISVLKKYEPGPPPKGTTPPLFCFRRNKILHGEFMGRVKTKAPEIEDVTALYALHAGTGIEKETRAVVIRDNISAYDQLLKFQKFLIKI